MRRLSALLLLCSCLSANDRQIANEVNALRSNPAEYAAFLEARLPYFRGNVLRLPRRVPLRTKEGASAVREAIRALRATKPLPQMKLVEGLSRVAADHVREIGPKGLLQHESLDGKGPADRVRRYARQDIAVGEVISFGPDNPRDVVLDLLIDDGVPGRGHRKLLLDPRFRYIGAACGPHATYRTMCVIDMAISYPER